MLNRITAFALLTIALTACAAPHRSASSNDYGAHDTTGITADSREAQTPRQTCFGSCTRDYNNCMDEASNSREALPGMGSFPSAGRGCDSDMKSCQKRCSAL